jgi:hypothetical protein
MKNTITVNGKKKVCVIYGNPQYLNDQYTVVLKMFRVRGTPVYPYLGVSVFGDYYHGESRKSIRGAHLGKRIAFEDVPLIVRNAIIRELA